MKINEFKKIFIIDVFNDHSLLSSMWIKRKENQRLKYGNVIYKIEILCG